MTLDLKDLEQHMFASRANYMSVRSARALLCVILTLQSRLRKLLLSGTPGHPGREESSGEPHTAN